MQRCTDIIVADAASSIAVSPARLLPPTITPPPLTRQQQRRHPPYEHAPLSSPTSIRLLTLHPATPTAPGIHCTLHEADLASPPAFEALSYTWALDRTSRTGRTRTIVCNGRALAAQRNLRAAQLQLRRRGRGLPLWVDAVCIDQGSDGEKIRCFGIYSKGTTSTADYSWRTKRILGLLLGRLKREMSLWSSRECMCHMYFGRLTGP